MMLALDFPRAHPPTYSAWYRTVLPPLPPTMEPQAGDEVVYLPEGHQQYLAATNDKRPPPAQTLRHGRSMRPAEPCR